MIFTINNQELTFTHTHQQIQPTVECLGKRPTYSFRAIFGTFEHTKSNIWFVNECSMPNETKRVQPTKNQTKPNQTHTRIHQDLL